MAIQENEMNPEQKAVEAATQQQNESDFASKLAESMDLPASLASSIEESQKEKPEQEEEVSDEEQSEETTEDNQEGVEKDSEEQSEEEEDLIPRSKVQKRFDEQTRQIKQLQSELRKLSETKQVPIDDTTKRLEGMSQEELSTLKRQVRIAQVKNASDDTKLNELLDLEEKIGSVERNAPQRFVQQQIGNFEQAVRETSETVENFDKVKGFIFNTAKRIFESSPELQSSVKGQERAWRFAVDQYELISKSNAGKSKVNELERQVNTLKKKVSVESSTNRVSKPSDNREKLFNKAKNGTIQDKENYFHKILNTDQFIPEEQLNR